PAGATVTGNVTMILTLQNNEDHTIFAVPNVVGLPIEAATRVLEQAGFNARVRFGDEFDAEGETDFVAYSQIPQGLSLPQGTDIIIIAQPR
ncbi:MAG: PASTA domain-containing protein, partial [Defluviitaleaceae bacterium]|nr:PASTA domain-containing protein [Defluviitaleaceae bacterium]